MADVKPEVIKKTQQMLGSYFTKPPLTTKLLKKPPFRFLHDIIVAVIKETGFLKGLFTDEELNAEFVKEKTAKLKFLNKLITVVEMCTGTTLNVKASKIISGLEPAKTNELLQAIGKAIQDNVSSDAAIKKYKKSLENHEKKSVTSSTTAKKSEVRKKDSVKKTPRDVEKTSSKVKSSPTAEESASNIKTPESKKVQDDNKVSSNATSIPESEEKVLTEVKEKKSIKEKENADVDSQQVKNSVDHRVISAKDNRENLKNLIKNEQLESNKSSMEKNGSISSENNLKKNSNEVHFHNESNQGSTNLVKMGLDRSSTASAVPRSAARPSSARPAAPRLQSKSNVFQKNDSFVPQSASVFNEIDDSELTQKNPMTKIGFYPKNDEDKELLYSGEEHGHLVAQILETQKDLVNADGGDKPVLVFQNKSDISSKAESEILEKEIESLRYCIQQLTRMSNPLGKLTDFLQENVEIMQKEYSMWINQNRVLRSNLDLTKTIAQKSIEDAKQLYYKNESDTKIEFTKIQQLKTEIAKNNEKIKKLIYKCS